MEKLLAYLNALSKEGRIRFVKACGTTEGYLRKAASVGQLLSAATCVAIERESDGAVTRKDLRPNDWLANWPELAQPGTSRKDDPAPAAEPEPEPEPPPSRRNLLEFSAHQPPLNERVK